MLLSNPQVQKELKLTEDQIGKIKSLASDVASPFGAGAGNFREMTAEQRRAFFADMQKNGEELAKKVEEVSKKLPELLTVEQNARLKQIQLWIQGSTALTSDADLAKQLSLTDDQKEALKTIADESAKKGQEIRAAMRNSGPQDWAKAGQQFTELRAETETECIAVLTAKQKAQFDKLKGPKFVLEMPQFGRGNRDTKAAGRNNN